MHALNRTQSIPACYTYIQLKWAQNNPHLPLHIHALLLTCQLSMPQYNIPACKEQHKYMGKNRYKNRYSLLLTMSLIQTEIHSLTHPPNKPSVLPLQRCQPSFILLVVGV